MILECQSNSFGLIEKRLSQRTNIESNEHAIEARLKKVRILYDARTAPEVAYAAATEMLKMMDEL